MRRLGFDSLARLQYVRRLSEFLDKYRKSPVSESLTVDANACEASKVMHSLGMGEKRIQVPS
jgi:hypothetical protein